jgi:hypothetical protein
MRSPPTDERPKARYCEYTYDDEGHERRCWKPAIYTTCDGLACEAHKCRAHTELLPAEDRIGSLQREVEQLRARVGSFGRRRKGYLYQLDCERRGRARELKDKYQAWKVAAIWQRRALEAEAIAKIAMTEGLKAAQGAPPPDGFWSRLRALIWRTAC